VKPNIEIVILNLLSEKPLTINELAKELSRLTREEWDYTRVKYHVKWFLDEGIIIKDGAHLYLKQHCFCVKGFVIMVNDTTCQVAFCPKYDPRFCCSEREDKEVMERCPKISEIFG